MALTALYYLVVIGALLYFKDWVFSGDNSNDEKIRNVGLIILAILGAPLVIWRSYNTDKSVKISDRNSINDIFSGAIDQLGAQNSTEKPNITIRLGGIYALEKLSKTNIDYYQPIIDILSSYIRQNRPSPIKPIEYKPSIDIQACLTVIGRRRNKLGKENTLNLSSTSLYRASLEYANLKDANLKETDLREAYLSNTDLSAANLYASLLIGANLERANLHRANLKYANLRKANLQRTDLTLTRLNSANLTGANLRGAIMRDTFLRNTNLRVANLRVTDLRNAYLSEADLRRADLRGAKLQDADLRGTDLRRAKLQKADLKGANLTGARLHASDLKTAKNWKFAYRDTELACGADIPMPPS